MGVGELPNGLRRLVPIHIRHLDVHENQVIVAGFRLFHHVYADDAVLRVLYHKAGLFQNGDGDFGIQFVVLGKQYAFSLKAVFIVALCLFDVALGIRLLGDSVRQGDGNTGSSAHLALHFDSSLHQIHQLLHYGHTQPGAVEPGFCAGTLSRKLLKQMGQEILGHTDARILDYRLIHGIARSVGGHLRQIHGDLPAGRGVFQGIAQNVQEDFTELCLIAKHIRVEHIILPGKFNSLFLHLGIKHGEQVIVKRASITVGFIQGGLAAFNPRHFQDIIDKRQQKVIGGLYLLDVRQGQFLIIQMLFQQFRKPDDGVHGRADIMGHIEEECGFRRAGGIGNFQLRLGIRLFMGFRHVTTKDIDDDLAVLIIAREHIDFVPLQLIRIMQRKFFRAQMSRLTHLTSEVFQGHKLGSPLQIRGINRLQEVLVNIIVAVCGLQPGHRVIQPGAGDKGIFPGFDIDRHVVAV